MFTLIHIGVRSYFFKLLPGRAILRDLLILWSKSKFNGSTSKRSKERQGGSCVTWNSEPHNALESLVERTLRNGQAVDVRIKRRNDVTDGSEGLGARGSVGVEVGLGGEEPDAAEVLGDAAAFEGRKRWG